MKNKSIENLKSRNEFRELALAFSLLALLILSVV